MNLIHDNPGQKVSIFHLELVSANSDAKIYKDFKLKIETSALELKKISWY